VQLNIVKTDTISPVLGDKFVKNSLFIGLVSILSVALVIFIRYRKWQVSIPIIITMISEVVLLLGMAALIGWNIDIAAIAGIIVAVGTGVDDQIVITDETIMAGKKDKYASWKVHLKNAFFIILAAYFATVVAMFPLLFAGAGLLKGFAITSILGVTFGVFITRPAYAAIVETLVKE
jgi:preprotein translocase subunit SecD